MEWNRSLTIGLAAPTCAYCDGLGLRKGKRHKETPCLCIFRAIFRICFDHFRCCVERQGRYTMVALETCPGKNRRVFWAMRNEDFITDFLLLSRRHLTASENDIFRFYFLLGADWQLCSKRCGLDRGNFFHAVYRIQQKLGRAFAETKPYSLYPLDEYFGLVIDHGRREPTKALMATPNRRPALRPPLRRIA